MGIVINISAEERFNYVFALNQRTLIQNIYVINNGTEKTEKMNFQLSAQPAFFKKYTCEIPALKKGEKYKISDIKLQYETGILTAFSETVKSSIRCQVYAGESCIAEESKEISLMPYDEMSNYDKDEGLRAAFVMPNHPEIIKLISLVSDKKGEKYNNYSIVGYQGNATEVKNTVRCIYDTICEQEIVYVTMKPIFNKGWQRARLVDEIMREKQANCMEMTCLLAALIEAAGLYPIMVITQTHAYVGYWTVNKHLEKSVCLDKEEIYRILTESKDELVVLESTLATKGKNVDYDYAVDYAYKNNIKKDELAAIVDVRAARAEGILPIPTRRMDTENPFAYPPMEEEMEETEPVEIPDKVTRWKNKLLDLTAGSDLLNIKITPEGKRAAQIPDVNLYHLYEKIKSGSHFDVTGASKNQDEIKVDLEKSVLHTNYTEEATKKLISFLDIKDCEYRDQKGASILYLTLGSVCWEEKKSGKWYEAPILMVPMAFQKEGQKLKLYYEDADIHVNAAVLEMAKARFHIQVPGINPEPLGKDGKPDLQMILQKMRNACKEEAALDITEHVHLGIFAFAQYMMWKDLDKNEEFYLAHPIIRSIKEGQKSKKIDEDACEFDENQVFLPITADGAQIKSMTAALGNQSFVLHGPPGTGKSQTITGMLANFIGHAHTVLFAAEKAAALQVVYNRMKKIGLAPFCLYLPVDSASRTTMERFLNQYKKLMEKAELESTEYKNISEKIKEEKAKLEEQLAIFTNTKFSGYSLKELVEYVMNRTEYLIPKTAVNETLMKQMQDGKLKDLEELLKDTMHMGELAGGVKDHPLKDWGVFDYKFGMQKDIRRLFRKYQEILAQISTYRAQLEHLEWTEKDERYVTEWEQCQKLLETLEIPESLRKMEDLPEKLTIWLNWLDVQEEKEEIAKVLDPGVVRLNLERMANKWKSIKNAKTVEADYEKLVLKNELCKYIKKEKPSDRYISEMFELALKLKKLNAKAPEMLSFTIPLNRSQVEMLLQYLSVNFTTGIPKAVRIVSQEDKDRLKELAEVLKEKAQMEEEIKAFLGEHVSAWKKGTSISETMEQISQWMGGLDKLREWSDYQKLRLSCVEAGMEPWITLYEAGKNKEEILNDFLSYTSEVMIREIYEENELVKNFAGFRFDYQVEKFAELMDSYYEVCAKEIKYRHLVRIQEVLTNPEYEKDKVAFKKIMESNGKGITIREIMNRIGGFVLKLTPCVMATPMTTSMYFPVQAVAFDHMILDEASQLQTCKSVGLIARSKHAIVVGDPNQMPPTSFFESTAPDYQLDVLEEDQESILKDFIALDLPDYYLRWHYRSHHESLIAFSNRSYYGGRMITFPASDKTSRVHVVRTEGIYDRGNTITNEIEAGVLVDHLEKMLVDGDDRSFGIIAFNKRQQILIKQLIEERALSNQTFANVLEQMKEKGEPLFVRNLESVQGDERDVILFSVGYGPDKEGKIIMAFGPLGKTGGFRRLNVAITRARDEMILFTSMDSEQMTLTETTSRGVKDLKNFMAYAEGKEVFADEEEAEQKEQKKDGFADAVCSEIKKAGYTYDRNVGNSSLKIDIAVKDKEKDSYILGIVLNSTGGSSDFTIYDSEIGQNKMLKEQGWNLIRIWSLDWFEDSEREVKQILDGIEKQGKK